MKRKLVIAIMVIQSVVILLLLMYAFVQKAEAEKQHQRAVKNLMTIDSVKRDAWDREKKMLHMIDSLSKQKADQSGSPK